MKYLKVTAIISLLLLWACGENNQQEKREELQQEKYTADWDSLAKYDETAEWFKDAKFGIYAHWGVLSVPAYANDWYPRNMHIEGTNEYKHHVETYGPHSEFGYHDYVPMFKAEEFDADAWAELWKKAGAKFGGIVAIHHDGWSNWDSEINPWNSVDMGPKKDIVGAMEKALKKRDMKFVATFHKARSLQIFQQDSTKWLDDTSYFPYNPELPTASEDSLLSIMYGNIPKEQFYRNWLGELKEVIDNYSPDLIYFDSKLNKLPDSLKRQFVAYYFNHSEAEGKQVVITHKEGELPKSVSLEDLEKGRMKDKTEEFWLTDETVSVGSWSYTNDLGLKTSNEIIDLLADIVSKNGALMLNVSPKANGIIPQNQQEILLEIGQWLETNGEAIYGTRTWEVYGEGPTKQEKSGMFLDKLHYTAQDVRYTQKGDNIYAIFLGWPGNNANVTLQSFSEEVLGENVPQIEAVTVLGGGEIVYKLDGQGLHLTTLANMINEKAFVVKISKGK
ncbi:alpha-L-fucosidase [Salinimicrobium sp. MT39]|uniref:alpha-L-fucosidase n=1 Tax=Salinimicrobium profundisediminis TaxID=2994553 RepID=A0A9X3CXG2_9FLAO|nr:alpha-L-fucosidase [Salinimicrobium profundisediminis]MCX2838483.1 alpha-L-fucosidase [Salinimicrobium profundisediminis]